LEGLIEEEEFESFILGLLQEFIEESNWVLRDSLVDVL